MRNKILQKIKLHARMIFLKIIPKNKETISCDFPKNVENKRIFELIDEFQEKSVISMHRREYKNLFALIKKVEKIKGEIAEVGVWKGSSAKLLADTSKKQVHLFDTFEGLPSPTEKDGESRFTKGKYSSLFENVSQYLKPYPNVHIYKGLFPETSGPIKNTKFSFVHLDVDLYESTRKCLEFFYPRMTEGGIIISHDYTSAVGVKKAFDEFFEDKPEMLLAPYADVSQIMIIKKSKFNQFLKKLGIYPSQE